MFNIFLIFINNKARLTTRLVLMQGVVGGLSVPELDQGNGLPQAQNVPGLGVKSETEGQVAKEHCSANSQGEKESEDFRLNNIAKFAEQGIYQRTFWRIPKEMQKPVSHFHRYCLLMRG